MSTFDKFANFVSQQISKAWFFTLCVAIVVIWLPSVLIIQSVDTWQLIINTLTTIITFLMVALLQNTQERNAKAVNNKLDALADGLADLMEHIAEQDGTNKKDLSQDMLDLRRAVGIEKRE